MIYRRGVEGAAPYAYETGLFDEPRSPPGEGVASLRSRGA